MAATTDTQNALADESRKNAARQKIANLRGSLDVVASLSQRLSGINNDTLIQLDEAQKTLTALEAGSGPGITADYGPKSTVTQLIEAERFAAKDAAITYIQANPDCTEADAAAAWNAAALASHPDFSKVIQDGLIMSALYRANLLAAKAIAEDTWEAHRAFILGNTKTTLESM